MKINFSNNDLKFLNFISSNISTILLTKNFKAKNNIKSYAVFYKFEELDENVNLAIYNLKDFLNLIDKYKGDIKKIGNKLIIKYKHTTINYDLFFEDSVLLPNNFEDLDIKSKNFFELPKEFLIELKQDIKYFNIEKISFEKNKIKFYREFSESEEPFIIKKIKLNIDNVYTLSTSDFNLLDGNYIVKFEEQYLEFKNLDHDFLYFFISTIFE